MAGSAAPGIGSAELTWGIPRKRMASSVLFTDGSGRVLLVEPGYKQVWELPGGAVEADESPRDAAAREVLEELGLAIEPGPLVAVDWVPSIDGRSEGVVFVYAGAPLSNEQIASIRLAPDELHSWAWCTTAEVRERMRPLVARRVEAALRALPQGGVVELRCGHPDSAQTLE